MERERPGSTPQIVTALLALGCPSGPGATTSGATETSVASESTSATTTADATTTTTGATVETTTLSTGETTSTGVSASTDGTTAMTTSDASTESPSNCDDGVQGGDEADVDCGGSCPGCPLGGMCLENGDCSGGICLDGVCTAPVCMTDGECPGADACNAAVCDPGTKTCGLAALPDATDCDDGLLCTPAPGTCEGGLCIPGTIAPIDLGSLPPGAGYLIDGELVSTQAGYGLHGVGDVNGDGLDDLAIGVGNLASFPADDKGRIYVVFGKKDTSTIDLAMINAGQGGFVIRPQTGLVLDSYVAGVGDVNLDGYADLVVASPGAPDVGGNLIQSGRAYVVFGKADTADVNLDQVFAGDGGFAIVGQSGASLGVALSGPGDVDGDGRGDILIGEPFYPKSTQEGRVLVVYGGDAQAYRTASTIAGGQGGFAIVGAAKNDRVGAQALTGAGDVDGDKHADLLIGAPTIAGPDVESGRLYFVRGKAGGTTVKLADVAAGQGGYAVGGAGPYAWLGHGAVDLGDVNGDNIRDFVVSAPYWYNMAVDPGRAYVIFGKVNGAPVDVAQVAMGQGGYAVTSAVVGDGFSYDVDALGDLNGDGRIDFGVAALRTPYTKLNAGRVSVVLGAAMPMTIPAADLAAGKGGFVIDGAKVGDAAWHVAGAGDVNGDGIPDVALGAGGVDDKAMDAGRVYVLFGPICAVP